MLPGNTNGYKGLQDWLQKATNGYKGLQGVADGYKGLQRVTRG